MWSAYDSYLSFFRHVAKLDIDYSKWDHWEQASLNSGFRFMHEEFCIVCDRPELLLVDDQNRPHSDNGPFCRWRDGSALYAVHGVRVPMWIVETPQKITTKDIDDESNSEVRRIMLDRFGWSRYIFETGTKPIDKSKFGILYRKEIPDDEPCVIVRLLNRTPEDGGLSKEDAIAIYGADVMIHDRIGYGYRKITELPDGESFKEYIHRVPPTIRTAHEAVAWIAGVKPEAYNPEVES